MKLLRTIVLTGCVGLLALTTECNRGEQKKQPADEAEPIRLGNLTDLKKQDEPTPWNGKGVEPGIVAEYEKLGGVYGGWAKGYDDVVVFQKGSVNAEIGLPGFQFSIFPKDKLPEIAVPFGLELAKSDMTDARLKDLSHLRNLIRLDLDPGKVTDVSLRTLREIDLLHALYLATNQDGSRPTSALEVYALNLQPTHAKGGVTDAGLRELAPLKNLRTLTPPGFSDESLRSA